MLRRWGVRRTLLVAIVAVILVGLGVGAFQPWTANHFQYALPGPRGLPFRITRGDRSYRAPGMCAGADWCADPSQGVSQCMTPAQLRRVNWWPVVQVGTMVTLAGPWYPIMEAGGFVFVKLRSDCYIVYVLEGGP